MIPVDSPILLNSHAPRSLGSPEDKGSKITINNTQPTNWTILTTDKTGCFFGIFSGNEQQNVYHLKALTAKL